jgi:hypothetical protein
VADELNSNLVASERPSSGRLRKWLKALLRLLTGIRHNFGAPLVFILSAVLLQILAALFPTITERLYARSIYPYVISFLSFFSRQFNFSLAEVLACIVLVVTLAGIVRLGLLLYLRPTERWKRACKSVRFSLWSLGAFLWVFLFCFGFNYERPLLFDLLGFERRAATAQELEAMSFEIIHQINANYDEAHAPGIVAPGREEIIHLLQESYNSLPELSFLPRGEYASPKPVYFSDVLTRLGISGIYFPFTAEPNYNADVPDFELPFTMAHEMAHQRGVARESEANFVAFLVCLNSSDPFIRYSGYRHGLGVVVELLRMEPEKAKELVKQLGVGYREDSKRAALFWAKASGLMGRIGSRFNDLYLRANHVRSGTADYAASTTLIIGYYLRTFTARPLPVS